MIPGGDFSRFQHPNGDSIVYKDLAAGGLRFAINCALDEVGAVNPYYVDDMAGFRSAGVRVGSYFVTRPEVPVAKQAADAAKLLANGPVWADFEDGDEQQPIWLNIPPAQVQQFWHALREGCPEIGIYSSLYFLERNGLLGAPKLWLAQWGVKQPAEPCVIWQANNTATSAGVGDVFDRNYFMLGEAAFDQLFPPPKDPTKPTPEPVERANSLRNALAALVRAEAAAELAGVDLHGFDDQAVLELTWHNASASVHAVISASSLELTVSRSRREARAA